MPPGWVPKAETPANFDLAQAFGAAITGDEDQWLSDWLHLLGGRTYNAANFCANVVFDTEPLGIEDFLGTIGGALAGITGLPLGMAGDVINLRNKLASYAAARVGSVYCELPSSGPGWTEWVCVTDTGPVNTQAFFLVPFPSGTTAWQWLMKDMHNNSRGDGFCVVGLSDNVPGGANWTQIHKRQDPFLAGGVPSNCFGPDGNTTGPALNSSTASREAAWFAIGYDLTATFCYRFYGPGGSPATNPFEPVEPFEDLPAPPAGDYTDFDDIGRELDRQERKLEVIRDLVLYLVDRVAPPAILIDDPVAGDQEVELLGAKGAIITVSGIPDAVDVEFGDPPRYWRLGRVTFGTTEAWFAAQDIRQNPMVVAPLPPYATRIRVETMPPTTATVKLLR